MSWVLGFRGGLRGERVRVEGWRRLINFQGREIAWVGGLGLRNILGGGEGRC
jgi:hypothetical protein